MSEVTTIEKEIRVFAKEHGVSLAVAQQALLGRKILGVPDFDWAKYPASKAALPKEEKSKASK